MYRVTVVAGPSRGTSFPLREGEATVGRHSTNSLVLNSAKVSKRHCTFVVSPDGVIVKDAGSSNGTFVNGVLAKTPKPLRMGDRISVGEFVLEIAEVSSDVSREPVALAFPRPRESGPQGRDLGVSGTQGSIDYSSSAGNQKIPAIPQIPQDLKGRLFWIFEFRVMPIFYRLLLKYEWHTLVFGSFGAVVFLGLIFSVIPIMDASDQAVMKELHKRASFMARLIVEQNSPLIQQRMEGKTSIPEVIVRGDGVRQALLLDLDSRIIAPVDRLNQSLTTGAASIAALQAKRDFLDKGRTTGIVRSVGASTVVAVEPLILYSPQEGKNIPVAMSVVSLDANLALPSAGDQLVQLSESGWWMGFFAVLVALILYRLTLKPLQVLNDEIDRSLKGETNGLSREIKFMELAQLQDGIETALQRARQSAQNETSKNEEGSGTGSIAVDDLSASCRMVGEISPFPIAFCESDRRPVYLNTAFEDVTGIRISFGESTPLSGLARDQAFGSFLTDLFDRSQGMNGPIEEEFEFSGVPFLVQVLCLGWSGTRSKGFILVARRRESA